MGECHDVLQAGRGRRAKAGRAALFTNRAVHILVHIAVQYTYQYR